MKKFKRGFLFIAYWLFLIILFELMRSFFIIYNIGNGFDYTWTELLKSMLAGLKMDVSVASYIGFMLIPFFIVFAFVKDPSKFRIFLNFFTAILILLFSLLMVSDAELYRFWQFRIDSSAFSYLKNPDLAIASTSTWRLIMLIFIALIFSAATYFLYWLVFSRLLKSLTNERLLSLWFLPIAAVLIIPIRGGVGVAPMNVGTVYFSDKQFVNHSGINVVWNSCRSLFFTSDNYSDFFYYKNPDEYVSTSNMYFDTLPNAFSEVKIFDKNPQHIVFVVLESFTCRAMSYDEPSKSVTPKLLNRKSEGIFFSNVYASGDRSEKGLISIFSSVPPLPKVSVMKDPHKSQKLPFLINVLKKEGYKSSFYYGGDVNFASMKSYLCQSGFDNIVSENDFYMDCRTSKWGYDDECMFEKFYDDLQNEKSQSVSVLFTLSSHEPYDVPIIPYGVNSELAKCKNAYFYTDSCLNDFLSKMECSPMWKNTLVVLVSDHGTLYELRDWSSPDKSRILMQWLGGAISCDSFVCDLICDQTDISATLLSAMDLADRHNISDEFVFSQDIFGRYKPNAFSVFGDGFSFAESGKYLWYSTTTKKSHPIDAGMELKAKVYCQKVADYYENLQKNAAK